MSRRMLLAVGLVLSGPVYAQSQAEIAAKLNDEGKELMYGNQYAEAAKKFQEAVARVPEAKYFFNLCYARLQEGKYDEALTACNAVELNNPTAELKDKADKLIGKIREEAQKQNLELHPGGGGGGDPALPPNDPRNPGPPAGYTPVVGRPPEQNLSVAVTPDNKYTWTLGAELFGGAGQMGQSRFYGSAAAGIRLKTDVLFNPVSRLGVQGYLQYSHFDQGEGDSVFAETLDVIDIGGALYKHICLGKTPRLCVTPLAGVHLSLMSPAGEMDAFGDQIFNYAGVGGRAEVAATYAFGRRFEHALSLMIGGNVYSPVLSGPGENDFDNPSAEDVGLDTAGGFAYFGLGYTYRFNTPIGSSPFVTLE